MIRVDYYPTILDATGVKGNPEHNALVDGKSLVPLLRDPAAKLGREALYWHYPHYHNMGATPHSAIREGVWRLVQFYEDGHAELFNLADDMSEEHDLAAEMPDKVKELETKLDAWRREVGAQDPAEPELRPGQRQAAIDRRAFSTTPRLSSRPREKNTNVAKRSPPPSEISTAEGRRCGASSLGCASFATIQAIFVSTCGAGKAYFAARCSASFCSNIFSWRSSALRYPAGSTNRSGSYASPGLYFA